MDLPLSSAVVTNFAGLTLLNKALQLSRIQSSQEAEVALLFTTAACSVALGAQNLCKDLLQHLA